MKTRIKNQIFTIGICGLALGFTFCMQQFLKNEIEILIMSKFNPAPFYKIDIDNYSCEIGIEKEIYYPISENEKRIVESIVAGEAGHDNLIGKMAVAQCILNACKQDEILPSEVRNKYQYSGWKNINQFEINYPEMAEEVKHAVWAVFDNGEIVTQENILWFYNPTRAIGKFHNTQKYVGTFGNHHRFYAPIE